MEVLVMNTALQGISILDSFESLIWTDRYFKYGDFEIYTVANLGNLNVLRSDYYLYSKESEHVMIIEGRDIKTDAEEGKHLLISGRSLESIIDRRIVWQQTILTGNLQNGIKKLLDENAISPTDPDRKIDNLIFEMSTDPAITSLTVNAQFTGDNLYDAIAVLCESNGIGFKVTLSTDNKFVFKLYCGKDRSYDQIENPYVVFSPKFENLINSNYIESKQSLRTVTLVAGEGEGLVRKSTVIGGGSGLARRELYTDARDLQMEVDGIPLTDAEYLAQLETRGIEKLSEYQMQQAFEGETESTKMFEYGEDFFIGDIVQLENEYGMAKKSRVTEIVRSQNAEGLNTYPTFTALEGFTAEPSGVLNPGQPKPPINADTIDNKHASDIYIKNNGDLSIKIVNPTVAISLDQYIASLKKEVFYFTGNKSTIPNITGIPNDIATDYMVTVLGGNTYSNYYYATITVESMTGGHAKYFGQLYNNNIFTGWIKIWNSNTDGSGSGLDADTVDSLHITKLMRSYINGEVNVSDPNIMFAYATDVSGNASMPNTDWWHVIFIPHNNTNGYGAQIAIPFHGGNSLYVRSALGMSWGTWREVGGGLGADLSGAGLTNSNSAIKTGMYYVDGSDPNRPAGMSDGAIFVMAYNSQYIAQLYMSWHQQRAFKRFCTAGTWSAWTEI